MVTGFLEHIICPCFNVTSILEYLLDYKVKFAELDLNTLNWIENAIDMVKNPSNSTTVEKLLCKTHVYEQRHFHLHSAFKNMKYFIKI